MLKNRKGFTFIELIVVIAVMALVGAIVSGMLRAGLSSYTRIRSDMFYETEARTALSLITVQLRRYDETGAIRIDPDRPIIRLLDKPRATDSSSEGTLIWFKENDSDPSKGSVYVGQVEWNVLNIDPEALEDYQYHLIAEVYDLKVEELADSPGEYELKIRYGASGERVLNQTISRRSAVSVDIP